MIEYRRLASSLVILLALWPGALRAQAPKAAESSDLPEYHVADAAAAVVTLQNLAASERFWPYQVALTEAWQPAGDGQGLRAGTTGVLIRVDDAGVARIDFGRRGLHDIQAGQTDLVERANRVRRGELQKLAPNFIVAIAPRLVDSASASLRPYPLLAAAGQSRFLTVFADPSAAGFAAVAAELAPLRERSGLLIVLFPQGEHPDAGVRERLQALAFPVPFVYDHLSEVYTRTLLARPAARPVVVLQTAEGRVILQSDWREGLVRELVTALDAQQQTRAEADR